MDKASFEHVLDGTLLLGCGVGLPLGLAKLPLQLFDVRLPCLGGAYPVLLLPPELLQLGAGAAALAADNHHRIAGSFLSGDCGGVLDDLHDLRVHLNVHVAPVSQPSVALLNPGPDPVGEGLPDHSAADVDDPLEHDYFRLSVHNLYVNRLINYLPAGEARECPSHREGRRE